MSLSRKQGAGAGGATLSTCHRLPFEFSSADESLVTSERPARGAERGFSPQLHGYLESEPLTLQLFIGTADDRLLRPHAFYQVHRITGKTVSTTSHEAVLSSTKVLEIPLLPENSMRAM